MQIKPQKGLEKIPKNKGKPEKRYVQIRGIEKLEEGSRIGKERGREGEERAWRKLKNSFATKGAGPRRGQGMRNDTHPVLKFQQRTQRRAQRESRERERMGGKGQGRLPRTG